MIMSEIKIGIIGAGSIAQYHIDGFRLGGARVEAIADVRRGAAESLAGKYGIPVYCGGLDEMLELCPDLDAISIVVPNYLHMPLTLEALKKGFNVYCEKPPALNETQVRTMTEAAEKAGKTLMFDFNNRARTEAQAMYSYIKSGVTGRINSAQALWIRRNGIPGFGGWFTDKKLSGGGPVIDLLHMIDLALYFMDYPEPSSVTACTFDDFMGDRRFKGPWGISDTEGGVTDVEAACHGFISFRTGQCLFIRSSWAEMNEREIVSVSFQGQKAGGRLARLFRVDGLDDTSVDRCSLYTVENGLQVNRDLIIPEESAMGRTKSAKNFVDVLAGRADPLNKPEEAAGLMKIIDAIYLSAREKKPIVF